MLAAFCGENHRVNRDWPKFRFVSASRSGEIGVLIRNAIGLRAFDLWKCPTKELGKQMASDELKALIDLRWANPYNPSQSIDSLRGKGPDGGRVPKPNTDVQSCDMDGVYGEWVVNGTPQNEGVFLFFHGEATIVARPKRVAG